MKWKADEFRKPLVVKGARQIGKTESIRKFAKENYQSFIEVNFVEEPKYKTIISDGYQTELPGSGRSKSNQWTFKIPA